MKILSVFVCVWLVLQGLPAKAADRVLTDEEGKTVTLAATPSPDVFRYTNERFGFSLDVSSLFAKILVIPDNGDGIILVDATGEARLRASGGNRIDDTTLKRRFEAKRKELGGAVAYSHLDKTFYVLSWMEEEEIHYLKVIFGPSVWCDMELSYPAARKKEFDPIVTRSANGFSLPKR